MLVGPSGSGKTTALRLLAGLEAITEGEIRIGDRVVNRVAPRDRDIAMVFQDYALYPQMTVYENLAFALRMRKMARDEIDAAGAPGGADAGASRTLLERKPRAALRRAAPACGARPRARPRAGGVPDGRAAVEPRREAPRADPQRDQAACSSRSGRRRSTSRTTRSRR